VLAAQKGAVAVHIPLRRFILLVSAGVVALAPVAAIGTASAAAGTMHISGPTSNKLHQNFNETISGVASSSANYVVAWEQYYKHSGCATTFAAESTRAFFPGSWGLTVWLAKPVTPGKSYSTVAKFGAQNLGVHGMCAYLINLSTGATYAHAGVWWTNHS
jgi:hypothetical protein